MELENKEWSSEDSKHCWAALRMMWSSEVFTNCLKQGLEVTEEGLVAEVESIVFSWNGNTREFSRWSRPKTIKW